MLRSVVRKLYELDDTILRDLAQNNKPFPGWNNPMFSYDASKVKNSMRLRGTDIYIATGFSATDTTLIIKKVLECYELDIAEDFTYSAMAYKEDKEE